MLHELQNKYACENIRCKWHLFDKWYLELIPLLRPIFLIPSQLHMQWKWYFLQSKHEKKIFSKHHCQMIVSTITQCSNWDRDEGFPPYNGWACIQARKWAGCNCLEALSLQVHPWELCHTPAAMGLNSPQSTRSECIQSSEQSDGETQHLVNQFSLKY